MMLLYGMTCIRYRVSMTTTHYLKRENGDIVTESSSAIVRQQ